MANSVEVRVPFCQPKIISIARSLRHDFLIDNNLVKKIVYQGAKKLLPRSVLDRKKQPFTLPIVQMLKKGFVLFDILNDTLNSQTFNSRGIFNQVQVVNLINKQLKEPANDVADFLWSIMMLELWLLNINGNLIL